MSEPFESETCGTCARFVSDAKTNGTGPCLDLLVRTGPGRYAYGAVPASGRACASWVAYEIPKAMCHAAEKQPDGLCLGYGVSGSDEPCETCKRCERNTINALENEVLE